MHRVAASIAQGCRQKGPPAADEGAEPVARRAIEPVRGVDEVAREAEHAWVQRSCRLGAWGCRLGAWACSLVAEELQPGCAGLQPLGA